MFSRCTLTAVDQLSYTKFICSYTRALQFTVVLNCTVKFNLMLTLKLYLPFHQFFTSIS